ncbi:hypothetical protein CEXT_98211 [Caerostris extrusa]|uniref:Uncharacterized protein n=1 Tax=Caerostris extrusa TaxID=172846 RepID=A0AAV4W0U9_CAEEX|nr:hypothetical protein CEXT_98211 [Caerostris extrusa]
MMMKKAAHISPHSALHSQQHFSTEEGISCVAHPPTGVRDLIKIRTGPLNCLLFPLHTPRCSWRKKPDPRREREESFASLLVEMGCTSSGRRVGWG